MIKFFRKIRQRLLSQNKLKKYLLYAIGEIVLVVIGILIAVQINAFKNEQNDQTNLLEDINTMDMELYNISYYLDGLESHIHQINQNLNALGNKDLSDSLRAEYCTAILSSPRFMTSDIAYKKIVNHLEGRPKEFATIFISVRDVYVNNVHELERSYEDLYASANSNHEYWRDNYSWYSHRENVDTMLIHKEDYTNNYLYDNQLAHYKRAFSEYRKQIQRQARDIHTLRLQIKGIQNNTYDLSPFHKEYNFTQLNPIPCEKMPEIGDGSELGHCHLFVYNKTELPVEMIWINHDKEEVSYGFIQPDRYELHRTFCGHRWLYKYPDGSCEVYYVDNNQTYINLE